MTKRLGSMMLLLTLLACGTVSHTTSGTSTLDGEWRLVTGVDADGRFKPAPGAPITMAIDGEVMSGSAGCNSYDGSIQIDGSSITARSGAMTEIGCSGRVGENEGRYINAVDTIDAYEMTAKELTFTGDSIELRFEVVPPTPTASFTATDFELVGLIEGSMMSSTDPSSITFHENGSFEADTGCRRLTGSWAHSGEYVETSELSSGSSSNRKCAGFRADQDAHIVGVLESGFSADIQEDMLTLTSRGGDTGLYYKAR